jgi:succinate-acetate transporter protein
MAQISVSSEHADSASGAHATPLALSAIALTTFFFGASQVSFFSSTAIIGLVFLFGGLVQFVIGLADHRSGDHAHAAIFATNGGFWLTYGAMLQLGGHIGSFALASGNELGFFFLAWTIFAGMTSLSTWRAHFAHVGTYLCFFLTFLALTIGTFATNSTFNHIGGWLGIVTAFLAAYSALASMGSPFAFPTGSR